MTKPLETDQDELEHNTEAKTSHSYTPHTSKCIKCLGALGNKAWQSRCGELYCIQCLGIWGKNIEKCQICDQKDLPVRIKNIPKLISRKPGCLCFECFYDV